jgi:hypothetical protein
MEFKIVLNSGKANGMAFQTWNVVQDTPIGMKERNEAVFG